jgi:integrase
VLSIQRKHIDFEEGMVTLTNYKNSSKTYRGFLDRYALEHLKEIGAEKLPDNYYIVGMSDKQVKGKTISNNLKPILDRLFNQGLEKDDRENRVVIHTLRHTFASHLAIKGASNYLIKELMNHKDIKDTLRYAKLSPNSGRKEVFDVYSSD